MNRALGLFLLLAAMAGFPCTGSAQQTIFFTEPFDGTWSGWFDGTEGTIDTSVYSPYGGNSSVKFHWKQGHTNADPETGSRRHFIKADQSGTETLYIAFDIKCGTSGTPWQGSGVSFHPHIWYILSDSDSAGGGLASNYLDTYIELGDVSGGNSRPRIALQDSRRIFTGTVNGQSYPTNNPNPTTGLLGTSNAHAVAGGNGKQNSSASYSGGANGIFFDGASRSILNNTWHRIAVYFAMNSVSGGVPNADGIMKYWVDGNLVIDLSNIYFRTGQYATQNFKTLVLSPFIGNGSPIAQDMWIDNVVVADQPPASQTVPAPKNLRVIP